MPCYEYGIGTGKDINLFPYAKSANRYAFNKPATDVDSGNTGGMRSVSATPISSYRDASR